MGLPECKSYEIRQNNKLTIVLVRKLSVFIKNIEVHILAGDIRPSSAALRSSIHCGVGAGTPILNNDLSLRKGYFVRSGSDECPPEDILVKLVETSMNITFGNVE